MPTRVVSQVMQVRKANKTIGDRELALLSFIQQQSPVSVADAVAGYGETQGLARSTVLTMMERLRSKGYLQREQVDGIYHYAPTAEQQEVVGGAIGQFVEKTLQGSLSPFVAWMSQRAEVSDKELAELEALVAQLQTKRREG